MSEPRISVLARDSGRTFASTGMVVLRESKDFFQRVISSPPKPDSRDFEAILTWRHETIHFIQSLSTAYLYSHSLATMQYAFNVLDNFHQLLSVWDSDTRFEQVTNALLSREFGLSVQDLLEGVAAVESFKMNIASPDVAKFLSFRNKFFPGDSNSCYRISFDYLSQYIGQPFAYHLLSPLSFLALQSDHPPKSFITIVKDILPTLSLDEVKTAPVFNLFSHFGMDIHNHLLYNLDSLSAEMRHPLLYKCIKYAIDLLGVPKLLEISARPSVIESGQFDLRLNGKMVEAVLPPMVVFSSTPGSKLGGMVFGLAKQDKELRELMMYITGLIGAAERLTLFRNETNLYQFCPHEATCPHYAPALCFNYFAPPSIEMGYKNCGFGQVFESRTGIKPDQAWKKLTSEYKKVKKEDSIMYNDQNLKEKVQLKPPSKPIIQLDSEAIRVLMVENKILENCDTSHIIRLFFKEMTIENATLLAGKIVLTFPKYDDDKRPNCTILEIRNFIRKLHNEEPRFPFYYVDETLAGMHLQHLACLSPIESIEVMENSEKFGLRMTDPMIIEDYLSNVDTFMQQLDYSETQIKNRINKIVMSIGLQL